MNQLGIYIPTYFHKMPKIVLLNVTQNMLMTLGMFITFLNLFKNIIIIINI